MFVSSSRFWYCCYDCNICRQRRKVKEREEKRRKNTKSRARVIFYLFVGKPLQTDFHQILHIMKYAKRNYLCKFWCEKINGFGIYVGRSNIGVSH